MAEHGQIAAITDEADGPVATWRLTVMLLNRYGALSPCWLMTAPVPL